MMLPLHLYPAVVQRLAALTPFPVLLGVRWTFTRAVRVLTINGG